MTDWNMYTDDCFGVSDRQLDPLGRATTFAYDPIGRQTSILDARGIRSTLQYDAASRLTSRVSTHDAPATFAYDAVGNRTEIRDGTGRSTFTYDLLNRRTGVVDPAGHGITYTYDAIGQRAAMTAPNGGIFTYAYGPRGQIDYLVNPQGDRTTFSYDAAGRRTLKELADDSRASYTYDAASQVAQVYNLKSDDSVIAGFAYDYDPAGNRTGVLESGGDRVTWTYDATNRLTREQRSGPSAYDTAYAYDPLGNRLVKDATGALTTSTYDLANQLVTSQDANGTTTYTYDLAGNLHVVEQPAGARTTTTWDDQNRQTGVLRPTGAITTNTFRFDGLRYSKQEPQATRKFLWDFNNYLAETDAADEIQAVYTNEPQLYGNLFSQYRKGPTLWLPSYYHYDALGSTRALTDDAGDVTDTFLYDAWGNELAVSVPTANPFRWVGRVGYYWDEGTGTFYIRARVYEPVTGRWMSQDPLSYRVLMPITRLTNDATRHRNNVRNLFEALKSNPATYVDPSGTITISSGSMKPVVNCGTETDNRGLIWAAYAFALDKAAPCSGWFFQHVRLKSRAIRCKCTFHGIRPRLQAEYWEWFGRGKPGPGGQGLVTEGTTGTTGFFDDERKISGINGTCGIAVYEAEVRFYCEKDPPMKTTPAQGTFPWPFGGTVPHSGTTPATYSKPEFWDTVKPVEAMKWRWQANWECCCRPPVPFASFRATQGKWDYGGEFVDGGSTEF